MSTLPPVIDSHCHLDFPDFAEDRDAILARAKEAGVAAMVTICTRVKRFADVLAVARSHPHVFCSVGTHPHNAAEEPEVTADDLCRLAEAPEVVAIGEAGLDYHYDHAPREAQARGLRTHIEAARRTGLPLVIHARAADADVEAILRDESERERFPFVLHCFSSGVALAKAGIELGGYVSFSGILTFRASDELRAIAAGLPLDRLLVETDAPYLAPVPQRGRRNEPAYVSHTAQMLARCRDADEATVRRATTENFLRLFAKVDRATVLG